MMTVKYKGQTLALSFLTFRQAAEGVTGHIKLQPEELIGDYGFAFYQNNQQIGVI